MATAKGNISHDAAPPWARTRARRPRPTKIAALVTIAVRVVRRSHDLGVTWETADDLQLGTDQDAVMTDLAADNEGIWGDVSDRRLRLGVCARNAQYAHQR